MDFHSLFEWELYYFCSFCYKAQGIFSDVVSGLNVDVYSLCFLASYTKKKKKRLFCYCKLIEIYFSFVSQKLGQEIL